MRHRLRPSADRALHQHVAERRQRREDRDVRRRHQRRRRRIGDLELRLQRPQLVVARVQHRRDDYRQRRRLDDAFAGAGRPGHRQRRHLVRARLERRQRVAERRHRRAGARTGDERLLHVEQLQRPEVVAEPRTGDRERIVVRDADRQLQPVAHRRLPRLDDRISDRRRLLRVDAARDRARTLRTRQRPPRRLRRPTLQTDPLKPDP